MPAIVRIVADPETAPLDPHLLGEAAALVKGSWRWLDPDVAVELHAADSEPQPLRQALAPLLAEQAHDWVVRPADAPLIRLLLADMDSTMITVECIDELADAMGLRAPIAAITARAMNGELDFVAALTERVRLLAGLPLAEVDRIAAERVHPSPGAAILIATMRARGCRTVLVSGGFRRFTGRVRDMLGFDFDEANALEEADGTLTGRLVAPIRDASSKLEALHRHAAELGVGTDQVLAIGDGANDLPMLRAAGLGIAYRAHATVRAVVAPRIDHTDLRSALYFQGISADAFVQP